MNRNSYAICTLATLALSGCAASLEHYIHEANPRLVPTYICNGDPTPTSAVWNKPGGVRGRIKIFTKNGRKVCDEPLRSEYCLFASPPISEDDVPLSARFYKHQEEKGRRTVQYEVLQGPKWTTSYLADQVSTEPGVIETFQVMTPVYVRCEDSPYGEKNTEYVCKPNKDGSGEKCVCPNQGGVKMMTFESVDVVMPPVNSVLWQIDASWFSPRVQTRGYEYQQGGLPLTISGPGVTDQPLKSVGSSGLGNNGHPSGIWLGTPPVGQEISLHTNADGIAVPVGSWKIRLQAACAEQ